MNTSKFNFRQLTLAREYRGYSQSELSDIIPGLSQPNLSKYEKGLGGLSEDILEKIIIFLDFPESFFEEKISNNIEFAHFRKRATIAKRDKLRFDTNIRLIGFLIDKMSESIEWPDFNFSSFDFEDFSPEYIATFTRNRLKVDSYEPILNINRILENNGVIVVEFEPNSERFDGVSFVTDMGTPVIILNKNYPNDRKRFTLAHELGHLIMHTTCEAPISKHRDKEDEANRFASEFLMPKGAIFNSLFDLKLAVLGDLKKYWLTSMAALLYRAKTLGCINEERSTYLNIELSRRGWKKNEPFDVPIDKPLLFQTAFKMHKEDLSFSHEDFVKGFSLPFDIIESYFDVLDENRKLRIVV